MRRHELVGLDQQRFQLAERPPRLGGEARRARGRHHRRAVAHQQRVPEDLAQPLERAAHRRLGLAQAARGTRHAALFHHRGEHAQQMTVEQIDAALHGVFP